LDIHVRGREPFRDNVFYLLLWRAILIALIAIVIMATSRIMVGAALLFGAHVALLFSLGVWIWIGRLDADRIVQVRAWRMLTSAERPAGLAGRRWACHAVAEVGLRFAKIGSVVAIGFAASSLLVASK
jgi:hypothetical protein